MQFLLRSGAHVNSRDVGLRTPLHIAARAARPEVVEELLESGADVNVVESSGQTALHLAAVYDLTGKLALLSPLYCVLFVTKLLFPFGIFLYSKYIIM